LAWRRKLVIFWICFGTGFGKIYDALASRNLEEAHMRGDENGFQVPRVFPNYVL
jgi:hypothetical protein